MTPRRFAELVAWLGVVFCFVTGVWAFAAPANFYRNVATFEPYNRHFLHDVGSFSIGLGVVLLLALLHYDALVVALGGSAVAGVLHEISHIVDRDLGGRDTDPVGLGLVALLGVAAVAAAWNRPPTRDVGTVRG